MGWHGPSCSLLRFRLVAAATVDQLPDDAASPIYRTRVTTRVDHPMGVVVGEEEQVLFPGLKVQAVISVLSEDRDLAGLLTFDLLIDMHHVLGAIQAVPGLRHQMRRHHGADDHRLRVFLLPVDGYGAGARRERSCGEKNAS